MPVIIEIKRPVIKVLRSSPSSLGTVNYHMVLFDQDCLNEFASRIHELAENIDDEEDYRPFFLLHSTSTRGEPIVPLIDDAGSPQFSVNRTNCDSCLRYYCLAYRESDGFVYLKTGFHSWLVSEEEDLRMPSDWHSIDNINGDVYYLIKIQNDQFWSSYREAINNWRDIFTGD